MPKRRAACFERRSDCRNNNFRLRRIEAVMNDSISFSVKSAHFSDTQGMTLLTFLIAQASHTAV